MPNRPATVDDLYHVPENGKAELIDDGLEDVAVEGVLVVELDGAVDLDHDPAAVAGRHEVDTDEVALDRSRSRNRDLASCLRRRSRLALSSQRYVGPPLSLSSVAANRPNDLSGCDDEPEVVAERRNELLDEDSLAAEPRARRELLETGHELGSTLAELDVASPAPEARLDDNRWLDRRNRLHRDHVNGPRVRQACCVEHASRLQLGGRGEEGPQRRARDSRRRDATDHVGSGEHIVDKPTGTVPVIEPEPETGEDLP